MPQAAESPTAAQPALSGDNSDWHVMHDGPPPDRGLAEVSARAAFVYRDDLSQHTLRADHPLKASRLKYTFELLEAYQAFDVQGSLLVEPRPATEEEVLTVHDPDYVDAVKSFSLGEARYEPSRFNLSAGGDNPIYEGMYDAAALSTGASLVAGEMATDGRADVAFNISGGLHHAAAGHASGFCVFNDPAIAIHRLLEMNLKVVYVDIDAHHGDGVQDAFYDTDRVLTISLHESGLFLFPGTGSAEEMGVGPGAGFSVNVPLYPYTDDDTYLWTFREVVPPLVEAFKPDVLVTQLGIDSHFKDPLTHLQLSSGGFGEAVKEFGRMGLPWVALGGGGYDLGAVARCWTLAYGLMLGRDWPDRIPQGYREKYGLETLRDGEDLPAVPSGTAQEARGFAEKSVQQVQRLIFPVHGLG